VRNVFDPVNRIDYIQGSSDNNMSTGYKAEKKSSFISSNRGGTRPSQGPNPLAITNKTSSYVPPKDGKKYDAEGVEEVEGVDDKLKM
jgi:hypothetical protein